MRFLPPQGMGLLILLLRSVAAAPRAQGSWGGAYLRFKTTSQHPTMQQEEQALVAGMEVRCEVCQILLGAILNKTRPSSEDGILDLLDGELVEFEETGDPAADRVAQHKRGCNKHFKDSFLLAGWEVDKCDSDHPGSHKKVWCVEKPRRTPEMTATRSEIFTVANEANPKARFKEEEKEERYARAEKITDRGSKKRSAKSEEEEAGGRARTEDEERDYGKAVKYVKAAFVACEKTIMASKEDIAAYLAEGDKLNKPDGLSNINLQRVCRLAAKCDQDLSKKRRRRKGRRQASKEDL
eukprot:TRINITY_DN10608_c0_g1_i4.p1 TRINITY_DN10608_c0_g1~~TRINITY_DN10608_c0_g1_i4.p1  ORF type:complete len:296 (-),score=83.58 TRINITY_DN10608_c0_g1_i4:248-1135(-)